MNELKALSTHGETKLRTLNVIVGHVGLFGRAQIQLLELFGEHPIGPWPQVVSLSDAAAPL